MTEITAPLPKSSRRGPLEIGIDRIWRFFCSVRAAIYEVAILAVLVLIGTLRGSDVPQWIADLIPGTQEFVDRWYAWDVYKSVPFAFMLGLLSVAIAICTINRIPGIWQSIAHPTVTTTHGFLASAEIAVRGQADTDRDTLAEDVKGLLAEKRYRVLSEQRNEEVHIYADRYRYGKLGTFPFHLALIMILIGGIVGARYGFRDDTFLIAEKTTEAVGHGTGLSIYLDDFQDSYSATGQAEEYRSDLVLYEDGREVKRQSITVNNPMTYKSTVVYQASFGPSVTISVADASGQVVYEGPIFVGIDGDGQMIHASGNPDALAGILDLVPLGKRIIVITPDSNPRNAPELDVLQLRSGEIRVQIRDLADTGDSQAPAAVIPQGTSQAVGDLTVTFVRESQWSLLQVARNPGIPIFWAAAFMLIGGLAIVFYFPHRRVRGIVSNRPGGGALCTMAPIARRDWSARRSFEQLATGITDRFGSRWRLIERDNGIQSPQATPASSAR
jgi:cytochrome c biogenesis protein